MTELAPAWIVAQRWFRSKQRPVTAVREIEAAPVGDGVDLRVVEIAYADGGPPDRYLLPTVDGREPRDGDGAWTALVRAIAAGTELRGRHGSFVCEPMPALAELLPSAGEVAATLAERRLSVEQSNTSVVLGARLILKVYRLLETGENPDLDVGAFLTEVGFADTPPVAGAIHYRTGAGDSAAVAMLQAYVPSRGDAWGRFLEVLAIDPAAGLADAAAIGDLTARMHDALASRPERPGFPARVATTGEAAAWRASGEGQLAGAIASVRGESHDRLVAVAPAVRERFADAFGRAVGGELVTRIHGDYHLGQLLARDSGGFSVIDFEGEPARPLEERRRPSSALRDVAGMLRSFDYAARTVAGGAGLDADAWLAAARDRFLGAYGAIGPLVEAFELEKACYEIRYEAGNRPDWLWLPLGAVERLVGGRGPLS